MEVNRFKELVHYLITLDEDDKLGAIKLNKALFFIDLEHYLETGKSISGETHYVRRPRGIVPCKILRTLEELESEGKINIEESEEKYTSKKHRTIIANSGNAFSFPEKERIRKFLEYCKRRSAKQLSKETHDNIWNMTNDGTHIPLYAYATKIGKVHTEDTAWVEEAITNSKEYFEDVRSRS